MTRTHRNPLTSIHAKVFGVLCAVTVGVVASLTIYFPAHHAAYLQSALADKAATYCSLLGRELESAVAFDDAQTAREVFEATAVDKDVRAMALFGARGQTVDARGELSHSVPLAAGSVARPHVEAIPGGVRCVAPVQSREGPRGVVVIDLSGDAARVEQSRTFWAALVLGALALVLGLTASWLVARSLARRLRAVAKVTSAVAAGSLEQPALEDRSRDEIGVLARSFNEMIATIRGLVARIAADAAEEQNRLGGLVAMRTEALDRRNGEMRMVLEHLGEGFFTVDIDGRLATERSAIVDRWLGVPEDADTLWTWVGRSDSKAGSWLKLGFEAVQEGFLPLELAIEQMPKQIRVAGRVLRLRLTPIFSGERLERLVVVLADVTAEKERERAEAARRDMAALFERVMADRHRAAAFMDEAQGIVDRVLCHDGPPDAALLRAIHTLKGNAGLFGLTWIAELCHGIESELCESGAVSANTRQDFEEAWGRLAGMRGLLGGRGEEIDVTRADLDRLDGAIRDGRPAQALRDEVAALGMERVEARLSHLAEHAIGLGSRLGKPGLRVHVDGGGLRLDRDRFAPLWSAAVHLLHNAIDHGIEPGSQRTAAGKPAGGSLRLEARRRGSDLILEIADDGRGVDWDAVASRARARGSLAASAANPDEALFEDGITTRDHATQHSGRGVGLGAVRDVCRTLQGTIEVISEAGRGTLFRMAIPAQAPSLRRSYAETPAASGP